MKNNSKQIRKDRDELIKLLKTVKRPANRVFLQDELNELELLLNPKIISSNVNGIANLF